MRPIKMLGLAVVMAMAVMAFIGASAASAHPDTIVLCEEPELLCDNPYPDPTTTVWHAEDPEFHTSVGTIICDESLMELTWLNELDDVILTHVLALTFTGNCKLGGTACTVSTIKLGDTELNHMESLEALEFSLGGTEVNLKCGSLINCTLGGTYSERLHSLNDGMTHLLTEEAQITSIKGFLCPKVIKLDANYLALGEYYIES